MKNCVIISTVHTAISSFNSSLTSTSAINLGATVIKATIEHAKINSQHIDEVIMGNMLQARLGQNPAHQALLKSRLAETVCRFTVNKVCGSGLKSVALATQAIQAGQAQSIVAGGMENMSLAPYLLNAKAHSGYHLGDRQVYDIILHNGLMCTTHGYHMGITTKNMAKEYRITHEMQDELALHSQHKAAATIESSAFTAKIIPVNVVTQKKTFIFSQDKFPKANSTAEALGALHPAFNKAGTVTTGNTSGINNSAATLVIMEESAALAAGLTPLAHIKSYASSGMPPTLMGMGPVPATQKALQLAGLQLADIDLIEANEAFAAQFLAIGKNLGFDSEKVNVNSRAITLRHPISASGAHILVTLLHAMQAHNKTLGLATLCIGSSQGIAMVIEQLN